MQPEHLLFTKIKKPSRVSLIFLVSLFVFSNHHPNSLLFNTLMAQDIHFSQIDINPVLYNPAYSGFFDGTGRFGISYRNQWASVSKAFSTVAATAEVSLMRRRYYRDGFNIGFLLYTDRAGTLHYGTSAGNIILSYYKALGSNNNTFISVAAEGGMGQAGFSLEEIEMRDPDDDFESTSTSFHTFGAGVAWFYQPNDSWYMKVGFSGRNLNRPNISYLGLDNTYIERKFTVYARAEFRQGGFVSVLPLAACMIQDNNREIMIGCDAKWYLSESSNSQISISGGLHYRWLDALLAEFTVEYHAFLFALTYDANISKLTPASKSIGSLEISVVYRLIKNKHVHRKAMPCPII